MDRILVRGIALLLSIIFLAGCGYTPTTSNATEAPEASTITYNLPVTSARVSVTLTLQECEPEPLAKADVTVLPVASASPVSEHHFVISGSDLRSFTKKRDVKLTLHPHGAISTVNTSVEDRTAAIIGSAINLVTLFSDASPGARRMTACRMPTLAAIGARDDIRDKITSLRDSLKDPENMEPDKVMKKIDALAQELARLETGPLQLKLAQTISFDADTKAGVLTWTEKQLGKWFDSSASTESQNFRLGYCVGKIFENGSGTCNRGEIVGALSATSSDNATAALVACREDGGDCSTTLVFRKPEPARMIVIAMDKDLSVDPDTVLTTAKLSIAQWGTLSYMPLSVGFGGKKSLSLTLDEFGKRTSFGWTSGATGEGAISGLLGIGEAVATAKSAFDSEELQAMKDDISELDKTEVKQAGEVSVYHQERWVRMPSRVGL